MHDDHRPFDAGDLDAFVGGTVRFHEQWGDALMNLAGQADEVEQFAAFMQYARRRHQHNVDEFAGHLADGLPDDARRRPTTTPRDPVRAARLPDMAQPASRRRTGP